MKRLFFASMLLLTGCKHKQYLTGYYSWNEFREKAEWDVFVDEKYKPKVFFMDSISELKIKDSLRVDIYLGTYCSDSRRWVPRYYKLRKSLPVREELIISMDTTKKDIRGMASESGVKKIPTFIFYDQDRELGRVVEKPKGRLEKEILQILKKK